MSSIKRDRKWAVNLFPYLDGLNGVALVQEHMAAVAQEDSTLLAAIEACQKEPTIEPLEETV